MDKIVELIELAMSAIIWILRRGSTIKTRVWIY